MRARVTLNSQGWVLKMLGASTAALTNARAPSWGSWGSRRQLRQGSYWAPSSISGTLSAYARRRPPAPPLTAIAPARARNALRRTSRQAGGVLLIVVTVWLATGERGRAFRPS